jgi:hypothetical protein
MYSDDRRLSDDVIAEIYRREIMTIAKEKAYMEYGRFTAFPLF